jgi:hypothetical protein
MVVIFLCGLIACNDGISLLSATQTTTLTSTRTITKTPTPKITHTPTIAITPQNTSTPTLYRFSPFTYTPSFSFTFEPLMNKTATPENSSECPVDSSRILDFHFPRTGYEASVNWDSDNMVHFDQEVLSYLSGGGDIRNVRRDLDQTYHNNYYYVDVTNDGAKDLIMQGFTVFGTILVYYCRDGKWNLFKPDTWDGDDLVTVQDLNLNGVPEIYDDACMMSGSGCQSLYIYEWNGTGFSDLSEGWVGISGPAGNPKFSDYNGDGIKEIILQGDYCGWGSMSMCFPWRLQTLIYSWDGTKYTLTRLEYTAPEYRYQAVQDADREFLYRNYSKALSLYTAAIEDKTLDWWSQARRNYEVDKWNNRFVDPFILPARPTPDPDEYDQLAAYSSFRIGLLYLVTGREDTARFILEELIKNNTIRTPKYPFVVIAGVFWKKYQVARDIEKACQAAIQSVDQTPETLELLEGTNTMQDHHYWPEDICPVTNAWFEN